ncbi:MDR family MFS transporter [Risungbinella massiliensis]|uniref:MDR family MFS transporter n=1 Tax=Risungbinella massiliensis TaxID=1329796 RepID=UPI0005CC1D59|nr:MDR family MFS transporter [Risungbinella massiliensis]
MQDLTKREKSLIMVAIVSLLLFAALNQTIIGNALPKISAELNGAAYYNWVFTIFMLTSSVTAILVGKLSDIYGRKPIIVVGVVIFMIGTFLCGTSANIIQLIIYRGVQGFGAGMIMSTAFAAVGDLFPPRERGKWQGILSATFGFSSILGPSLGGYIVEYFDWHWIFWVFLPIGVIALVLIFWLFPKTEKQGKQPIDLLGSFFVVTTIVPLLLAFSWAGKEYAWSSWQIIGLFITSVVSLIIFIWVEKRAVSPVIPLDLFGNSIFTLSNVILFLIGFGMFGTIIYAPFFIQGVMGLGATESSFITMALTLAMVVANITTGQIMSRTGKYKKLAIVGGFTMALGLFLLSFLGPNTSNITMVWHLIIVGIGLGIVFPVFSLTAQNAVSHKYLGVATSSVQLFRQIGGTIGVAILGTVLTGSLTDEMSNLTQKTSANISLVSPAISSKLAALQDSQILTNADKLQEIRASLPASFTALFDNMLAMLREAFATALNHVFLTGSLVVLFGIFFMFFVKEIPLRTSNKTSSEKDLEHSCNTSYPKASQH